MKLTLLVDHDNVPFDRISPRQLITTWLESIDDLLAEQALVTVTLRAYGGWFLERNVTESRFAAAEFYQRSLPIVFFHYGRPCKVAFQFADTLISERGWSDEGSVRITHTVAVRPCAQYMKVVPGVEPCDVEDCELTAIRKWARVRRACTYRECPNWFSDYFERKEQKQVDVHLSIDLLLAAGAAETGEHVAVASEDWDILPAIAASADRVSNDVSLTVLRFRPGSTYLDSSLEKRGVRIATLLP